jgi:hypothetical protein
MEREIDRDSRREGRSREREEKKKKEFVFRSISFSFSFSLLRSLDFRSVSCARVDTGTSAKAHDNHL